MRIAQIAPLFEAVPPQNYGGTERIVSCLTEELVRRGHEVTLFASADSNTSARLIPCAPHSLRTEVRSLFPTAHHLVLLEKLLAMQHEFDVIHFHIDSLHFSFARHSAVPSLTTLHGRLDIWDLEFLYDEFPELPMVSISNSQRTPLPHLNWAATIYHGITVNHYRLIETPDNYLAFLGRISPEKGAPDAIRIAARAGLPLKVAAKINDSEKSYFTQEIEPHLNGTAVEFVGEIGDKQKSEFLGRAKALLFPIDWPEPFGLVMIEALACGTPVIAYRRGSVSEVIDDGVTGFITDSEDEAVAAIKRLPDLSRRTCRETCERRFSVSRMTDDYLTVYGKLSLTAKKLTVARA